SAVGGMAMARESHTATGFADGKVLVAGGVDSSQNALFTAELNASPADPDVDKDGIPFANDNCPSVANPDQSDANANGLGDACDSFDTDGDGLTDREEWIYGTDPAVADQDLDGQTDGRDSNPFDATITGATPTPLNDDAEFVRQICRDFLNREADQGGLNYWVTQLSAGTRTRAAVVEQYLLSAEFGEKIAPVARLYFAYFNRLPDYGGLMYWVNEYSNGNSTLNNISDFFAGSSEFQTTYNSLDNGQFVDLIYANLFNRSPDSGGRSYWVGELDAGNRTRGEVMVLFSDAQEYRELMAHKIYVTMTYIGLLRRSPDQAGFDYWASRMGQGASGQGLIDLFLTSAEYAARFDGSGWTVPAMTYAFPYNRKTVVEDEDEGGDGTVDTRYITDYFYAGNNRLTLTVESYDAGNDGSINSTITTSYAYDGNGNLQTVIRSNDWDNDASANSIWTTAYELGPYGQVLQRYEFKDYDADGTPEVMLPTLYTWNSDGLLSQQITATDSNADGFAEAVEMVSYNYAGGGQLVAIRTERDAQNDGVPESIRAAVYSWSGALLSGIATAVDSDGDTATDWTETYTFSHDSCSRLTGYVLAVDQLSLGGIEDTGSLQASYDGAGNLTGTMASYDAGNDGTADYGNQKSSSYTALGLPTGSLPGSADCPVVLPVVPGMLSN
ncbi:MAG: DUF4214 domain-containing protein, partial [Desulfuromonadales bacterium]|nr:DUF4214 domain-containing protein [Desulfuromonadales bacterium]